MTEREKFAAFTERLGQELDATPDGSAERRALRQLWLFVGALAPVYHRLSTNARQGAITLLGYPPELTSPRTARGAS